MQFNIIFKTIFVSIHKKFRFVHTNTFCKYRKKLRASPRVHLVLLLLLMDCTQKSTFHKLCVAFFNNAYRRVLILSWRCSASAKYANFRIQNFEAVIRKSTYGFIKRLHKSTNSLIIAIEKS